MDKSLSKKIRAVEDEHAADAESTHLSTHDRLRRDQAMQMLGAAKYADSLRATTASQIIQFLITVEEEKLYRDYGYERFVDFLNNSELSEMSKSTFYTLRERFLTEGAEQYDYFTAWKIPLATRRLLSSGDIQVDGDEVVIGGEERVPIGEQRMIKSVIEQLVKDKLTFTEDLAKAEKRLEKQKEQLRQGQDDFDQLQRTLDALKAGNPYERALSRTIYELLELTRLVGQLPDNQKAGRGRDAMPLIWAAIQQVKASYGTNFTFEDSPSTHSSDLDEIAAQVLDGDDD